MNEYVFDDIRTHREWIHLWAGFWECYLLAVPTESPNRRAASELRSQGEKRKQSGAGYPNV